MKGSKPWRGIALLIAAAGATAGWADTSQTHRSIRQAAESFITAEVRANNGVVPTVEVGHLDSRLRLAACETPLQSFLPSGGRLLGNTTVGVRCTGKKPWSLYVPVKVRVKETVVVTARPLSRGALLQADDLTLSERDLTQFRSGYFTRVDQVSGQQMTRAAAIGTAVTPAMLKNPRQIKRGQQVSLVAEAGRLKVRMSGKALMDGAKGERIQVRNTTSKRVVEGVVASANTVLVDM